LLPSTQDFKYLVYASLVAVVLANFVFSRWAKKAKLIFGQEVIGKLG
jgi:hypothetical protein